MEKFKKLGVFVATAAALASAQGFAAMDGAWTYEVGDGGTATLTAYAGDSASVTIPVSVGDGVAVVSLGDGLFANHTELEEVRVEAALTSVGTDVFAGCTGLVRATIAATRVPSGLLSGVATLADVTLEEGLESLDSAFIGCTGIGSVVIPDSVTYLSSGAFYNCTGITNLVIGEGVADLCGKFGFARNLERLVIGGGVKQVGCGGFGGLTNLTELVFREGVEVIWEGTFSRAGIGELRLPNSLQRIEGGSLGILTNLTNIVWGAGIRDITGGVFANCSALTDLTIPASVTNLSGGVFGNCTGLTNLVVNANIETYARVFSICPNLEKVVLGDGVGAVGDGAFAGYAKLGEVELGANVASIGEGAFSNCMALASITLPDSVESVGANAFSGCMSLASLDVPVAWYGTEKLAGAGVPAGCAVTYRGMSPVGVATAELPGATVGWAYEAVLAVSGGLRPYRWSVGGGGEVRDTYEEQEQAGTFSATGTAQGWTTDDGCWELSLPFGFPFFGETYDRCYVSDNGTVCFSDSFSLYYFDSSAFLARPMIAAMWADLYKNGMDVYVERGTDWVKIRWQTGYWGGNGDANFSATLRADGTIVLSYGSGNSSGGRVGISAGDGSTVLYSVKSNIGSLANAADVVFLPPSSGGLPGWLTLTEVGGLSGTPDEEGEWTAEFVVTDAMGVSASKELTLVAAFPHETVDGTTWSYRLTDGAATVVRVEPADGAVSIPDRLGGRLVAGVADGVFAGCAGLTAVEAPESWYGTGKLAAAGLPTGCAVSYRGVDPLAITTSVLPEAMAGVAYETVLAASGGKTPYAWSVLGGGEYQETSAPNSFAATGTAQGWNGDDSCWDLTLPFEFPFFGNTYTRVKVNSNGTLSFGSSSFTLTTYDESLFRSTPVIAVLWKDLRTDNGGNVYVESSTDDVTIRWQGTYYSGGAAVNFAATLHKNGKIVLSYGSGNASGGYIGISAGDGSTVLVSTVPSNANLSNAADIVFEPPHTLPEGLTLTEGGVLSGTLEELSETSLVFQVTDAVGLSVEKEFVFRMAPPTETVGGTTWQFRVDGGTATVLGATPAEGALTVPATLGGLPVAAFADQAFLDCTGVTRVEIPGSVKHIGDAFRGCTGLTEVVLGEGVETLGGGAFQGTGIANLVLPDSVTSIQSSFQNCASLTNIAWGTGIEAILYSAFDGCTALTDLMIPSSVTNFAYSFGSCTGLTNLEVYARQATLGGFSGTTNLQRLVIGGGVKEVTNGAFGGLASLDELVLCEGVEKISNAAFTGAGIEELTVPESMKILNNNAFSSCANLMRLDLGTGVQEVAYGAFGSCAALTELTIPPSVTNLLGGFSGCAGITNLTVNATAENLRGAFEDCTGLQNMVIGDGVASFGGGWAMFEGCNVLETLSVPGAWYGTAYLSDAEVPEGCAVTYRGVSPLAVVTATLPVGGEGMAYRADLEAAGGRKPYAWSADGADGAGPLPAWLSLTADGALRGRLAMAGTWSIGLTVTDAAGVSVRRELTVAVSAATTGTETVDGTMWTFAKHDGEAVVTGAAPAEGALEIPGTLGGAAVTAVGGGAFAEASGLTSLVIPDGVTVVGAGAFEGCTGLETLEVPGAWQGTDILAAAGVPAGCEVVYRGVLAVATRTLPVATVAADYAATLEARYGQAPLNWIGAHSPYAEVARANSFAATGTAQGWRTDDGCWEVPLPFGFPFFGQTYDRCYVSDNGTISFGGAFSQYWFDEEEFLARPMIAAMWADLGGSAMDIFVERDRDSVTLRWATTYVWNDGYANFSTTLKADGTIVLAYGEGNARGGIVGISAGDGTTAQYASVSEVTSLENAEDVVFMPVQPLPEWLEMTSGGVLAATPGLDVEGTHSITVLVMDRTGALAQRELTLTVAALTETVGGVEWAFFVQDGAATLLRASPVSGALAIPETLGGCPVTAIWKGAFAGSTGLTALVIPDGVTVIGENALACCTALATLQAPGTWYGTDILAGTGLRPECEVTYREVYPLAITTTEVPDATLGEEYETELEAEGGRSPHTWVAQWQPDDVRSYEQTFRPNSFQVSGTEKGTGDFFLDLPFEFPFFGKSYEKCFVSRHGVICFGGSVGNIERFPFVPSISILGYGASSDRFFVDAGTNWVKICSYYDAYYASDSYSYSATLHADGTIVLSYGKKEKRGIIGLSAGDGMRTQVVEQTDDYILENADDIVFTPVRPWVELTAEGVLQAHPGPGDVGEHSFTVIVTDAVGRTARQDLTLTVAPLAETVAGTEWAYVVKDGAATVLGAEPAEGALSIPETLGGCPVTEIGKDAFAGCTALTGITIPGSVAVLGEGAFAGCTGLTEITIPENVAVIGDGAFQGCAGLTTLSLSSVVESLGADAFTDCTGLETLSVPGEWYGTDNVEGAGVPDGCAVTYQGVSPVTVATEELPEGLAKLSYEATLAAEDGSGPYTWRAPAAAYDESFRRSTFRETGTAMGWQGQDKSWDLALPFEFPFFGNTYTTAKVSSNGGIMFGDGAFQADYYFDWPRFKANPTIAVLGTGLNTTGGDVYVDSGTDWVKVRWQATRSYGTILVNVSVTLHRNGKIVLSYGSGFLDAFIGVSAGDGETAVFSSYHCRERMPEVQDIVFTPSLAKPEWLEVTGDGVVHAWPPAAGDHAFEVVATDALGVEARKELTLTVADSAEATETAGGATWTYVAGNGGATIVGATPESDLLEIPATLGGVPVTAVWAGALDGCGSATLMAMPATVEYLGEELFAPCTSLKSLFLPESLRGEQPGLSLDCTVYYGEREAVDGVTWCYRVEEPGRASLLRGYPMTGDVSVPGVLGGTPVVELGPSIFSGCSNMTSLVIPDSALEIGWRGLYGTRLSALELPASWYTTNNLDFAEFYWRDEWVELDEGGGYWDVGGGTIPNTNCVVTYRGVEPLAVATEVLREGISGVFYEGRLEVAGGVGPYSWKLSEADETGQAGFWGELTKAGEVRGIPDAEGEYRFVATVTDASGRSAEKEVVLTVVEGHVETETVDGRTWRYIAGYEMATVTGVEPADGELDIPEALGGHTVAVLRQGAFANCTGVTAVTVPDCVESLGTGTFAGCTGLTNVVLGSGVADFDIGVFAGCENLMRIETGTALEKAVQAVASGGTVVARAGRYTGTSGTVLTSSNKLVRVVGAGAETTFIDGEGTRRCADLGWSANTVLEGFTLMNGTGDYEERSTVHGGTLRNCVVTNCQSTGSVVYESRLEDCTIAGNHAESSDGVIYDGTLVRCRLTGNSSNSGAAARYCNLENCLVAGNYGIGVQYGTATHCTIAGNTGRGTCGATLRNSIVWGNGEESEYGSYDEYSCCEGGVISGGCIALDPQFADAENGNYALAWNSPCLDAGSADYAPEGATDLAGNARTAGDAPDMGAYEAEATERWVVRSMTDGTGSVEPAWAAATDGMEVTFTAIEDGRAFEGWLVDGEAAGTAPTLTWRAPEGSGEVLVTAVFEKQTFHVDAKAKNDESDGSEESPLRTIQAAIDRAVPGDTVLVGPGTYGPITTFDKKIRIVSVEGAERTKIDPLYTLDLGRRCATLANPDEEYYSGRQTNSVLEGFTLAHGEAEEPGYAGGALGGTLVDCVVTRNKSTGLFYGNAFRCRFTENISSYSGGGMQGGSIAEDCVFEGNQTTSDGGGMCYVKTVRRCEIRNNKAVYFGGGVASAELMEDCTVEGNSTTYYGGGAYGCKLVKNCRIAGNSVEAEWRTEGGGLYGYGDCTAINCVVTSNTVVGSAAYGGGTYGVNLVDCEISDNTAWGRTGGTLGATCSAYGGGVCGGTATNCAIRGNLAAVAGGQNDAYGGGTWGTDLTDCQVTGNTVQGSRQASGGGACSGMARRSEFSGNRAVSLIADGLSYGGGANGMVLDSCVVSNNTATIGGGLCQGNASACLIIGNHALRQAGGAYEAELENCIVARNTAVQGGGIDFEYRTEPHVGHNNTFTLNESEIEPAVRPEWGISNNLVWGERVGGRLQAQTLAGVVTNYGPWSFTMDVALDGEGALWRPDPAACDLSALQLPDGLFFTRQESSGYYYDETAGEYVIETNTYLVAYYPNELEEASYLGTLSDLIAHAGCGCAEAALTNGVAFEERMFTNFYKQGTTPVYEARPCPMVDPWNGDFRLVAGSGAIDAGAATELETDLAGNPRMQGAAPDLGALESAGGVPVEGTRLTVTTEGSGRTDIEYAAAGSGGGVTVTALGEGRPFVGWKVDGEIVSTERTYVWEGEGAGILTAVFGPGDIWVDAENGDDANDGTEAAPLATLQAAVRLAGDGDRVRAKPGTYGAFTAMGKTIEIIGEAGAEKSIIDGRSGNRCATLDGGATLAGFTLRKGASSTETVNQYNGAACAGGHLTDCIVEYCGTRHNGMGWSGDFSILYNTELTRCIVRDCRAETLFKVCESSGTNRNTIATGNHVNYLWYAEHGAWENRNMTLVGNEVMGVVNRYVGYDEYGNRTWLTYTNPPSLMWVLLGDTSRYTWRNSIIWGNGATWGGDFYLGDWSCIEGATQRAPTEEAGPIWAADPKFVDVAQGDYRLADFSPYVDMGNSELVGEGETDLAGNARIAEAGVDLGCFEEPVQSFEFVFDLGEHLPHLIQLDDLPLTGRVARAGTVAPPTMTGVSGWRFEGWTPQLEDIRQDMVFTPVVVAAPCDWQAIVHRGAVMGNETWAAGTVHVVDGTVTVAAGRTLTIGTGAIVKLAPGAQLLCSDGGLIVSMGATFTHLHDDDVGGDTLGDGAERVPVPGEYTVSGVEEEGQTTYRYDGTSVEGGGGQTAEIVWKSGEVHVLRENYVVEEGQTLRLQAGTVVKLDEGRNLVVEAGGMLIAEGTVGRPVILTSIYDDEHGGDTNGDGDTTYPQPGDWASVKITGGTARLTHTHILYASCNPTTGAINMPVGGGSLFFDGGEIAHCLYDAVGVEMGNDDIIIRNAVIRDSLVAFRHCYWQTPVVNCVIDGCGRLTQGGTHHFVNCVFSRINETWEAFGFPRSDYKNCVFWNEGGSVLIPQEGWGAQDARSVCGQDGNIWGNPKFADPANGDFHLTEGSVCIDSGDGSVSPKRDRYGNGRVTLRGEAAKGTPDADGNVPDIGVHEFGGRYSGGGAVDVVATELQVLAGGNAAVAPGAPLTLAWRLENTGEAAFAGTWTDRVKMRDAAGRETVIGDIKSTGRIEPGTSKLFWGEFAAPAAIDGEWTLCVDANFDRGVLEGANTANNAFVATNTLTIANLTADVDGGTVLLSAGAARLVRLTGELEEGDALWVGTSDEAVRVTAWGANGTLPAAESHWTCAATADGGTLVSVGALWTPGQSYLLLQNEGSAAATATITRDAGGAEMVATGLERTEVAAGPMVAVVLEGVGLGGTTVLELLSDGQLLASGGGVVATSGKVSAVFDLSGVAADTELWVRAKDGAGRLATSPVPLRVTQTAQAQLEFWLELPDAVREGRTYRGQVRYRNAGDTDMEAPIFKVFDSLENATVSPSMNSAFALDGCLLTGRGNGTPWIVLKAGDEGAVDFYYTVMGANQLEVRWIKGGGGARTAEWLEMMAKEERRQLAAAEAAAAAEAEWAATGAQALAEFIAANTVTPVEAATGTVAGTLTDVASGEGVAWAAVRLVTYGKVSAEGTTEDDGRFVIEGVWPPGRYRLEAEGWSIESGAEVEVSGNDTTEMAATARRLTRVTGTLTAGGEAVEGVAIEATAAEGGGHAECVSGEGGAYDLGWLEDGTWTVRSDGLEGFTGAVAEFTVAGEGALEIPLAMSTGMIWGGRVVDAESGEGVEDVEIGVCDENGTLLASLTSGPGGDFRFDAVPPGTLRVASLSPEWVVGDGIGEIEPTVVAEGAERADVPVSPAALARAFPDRGPAPLTVQFDMTKAGKAAGAVAWAWDFDGDGDIDSTDEDPMWEFAEPGEYDVSVVMALPDGTSVTGRPARAVTVRERLATIYRNDTIVLLDDDPSLSTDWKFISWDETTGTLVVRAATGTPSPAMAAGVRFAFRVDGQLKLKIATAVSGPATGRVWTVKTEDVTGLTDIYVQFDLSASTLRSGGGAGPSPLSRRGGMGGGDETGGSQSAEYLDGRLKFTGSWSAYVNYSIANGVETRDIALWYETEARLGGRADFTADLDLGKLEKEILNIPFANEQIQGLFRIIIDSSFSAQFGLSGSLESVVKLGGVLHVDDNSAWLETDHDFSNELHTMLHFGAKGYFGARFESELFALQNSYKVSLGGQLGMDFYLNTELQDGRGRVDFEDNLKLAAYIKVGFGENSKTLDVREKEVIEKRRRQFAKVDKPTITKLAKTASGFINDIHGGSKEKGLGMLSKILKNTKDPKAAALAGMQQGSSALLSLAEKKCAERYQTLPFVGAKLETLTEPENWDSARSLCLLPGVSDGEEGERQRRDVIGLGILKQVVNGDVGKRAAIKGKSDFDKAQFKGDVKKAIDETVGSIEENAEDLVKINIGGGKKRSASINGEELPNEIVSATVDYGDGEVRALQTGENTLSHAYDRAGYYLAKITVEQQSLNLPDLSFLTQVQDFDVEAEGFPTAAKAALVALAEGLGLGGRIGLGADVWGSYSGDSVTMGLKALLGLNPVDWNTSQDGIDDFWKLKKGLDPREDNADQDPDGDGLTNWQEYQAEDPNGPTVAPHMRRMLRGGQPNTASAHATDPLFKDTDHGGVCDGDEMLWGSDPLNPNDDSQVCKGCLQNNGTGRCICAERLGHHCECGGCEECMPEQKDDDPQDPVKSNDPNEIAGPPGVGDPETDRFVMAGDGMDYTIYFENKADAEASAQEIWIEMQLDPGMDWSTFEAGSVQMGNRWDEGLRGKANWTSEVAMAEGTYRVRSRVSCDPATGKVEWYLRVVDPEGYAGWPADPYAGMLPPNDPETHCGEGAVTFHVQLRDDAEAGSVVGASATITFDYNEPIETDPSWWNKVTDALHEVTFVDEDGTTVLKEATRYVHGTAAADIVQPEEPTKEATAQYEYAFAGWEPPLAEVTEDATYAATYAESLRSYAVRFEWHGGECEATYEYGTAADALAVPDDPPDYTADGTVYRFAGWSPVLAEVTEAATYVAQYAEGAAIAQIVGGEVYPSLAAAVAAAAPGATVLLLADDEVSFAEGGVVIDKDIVIDGAGFMVKGVSNADIHNVTANATPPDVEFDGVDGSNVRGFFVKAGNVTFTNLVMSEFGDTDYVNKFGYTPIQTASAYDGTLTVADVDIDKFNRTAICIRGGTFSISGGTITANAANRDVETLGKDHFQQPIEIRGGTGTIDGVTVTSEGYPYASNGGGAIVAWSDVTVRDVAIDFTGVGIWADYADIVVEGENTSVAATDKAMFVEDGGSIAVAAGDFTGELAVDAVEGSSIVVNGGTFDAPVPTEFVGDGFAPTALADANGKYTVRTARTVTFDANGGTAVEAVVVADGEPVAAPDPVPEKQYCTFRAWQLAGEDYDFATPVTADITLVADWARKLQTVTFDPSPYGTFRGEPTLEMTFEIGGTYHDLPGTTPDGTHARLGWYTMPDGEGGEPVVDGDDVTGGATLTLYAHWTDKQTLTFDAQNGAELTTAVYAIGGTYGTLPKPTWAGHAFLGWFTEAAGGKKLSATSIVTTRPTRTMYAHWTTEQTVIFDAQGGACDPSTKEFEMGGRYGSLPKPTKAGYTFVGWYTLAEGGNHLTANSIVTTLKTRTFYAHWTNEQTVIFDAQGGACEPATMVAEMGGRYGALPKPTKAGYAFVGWYTKAEGGNHLTANSIVTTLKTRTFYAHWTNEQTVTFDAQGGTCDPKTLVATVGEPYGVLPVPEKEGQKFLGWYTKTEGGSKVSAASIVTAVTKRTLYAHWKESAGTLSISGFSRSVRAGTLARDAKFDADEYLLVFVTEAGVTYEVQWTAELGGEWTTLKSWTADEDGETAVTVSVPAASPTGFFRVVEMDAE